MAKLPLGQTIASHLATARNSPYMHLREVGAGRHLANPVRSGRKQP